MNDNNDLEQIEQLIERLEKDFSDLKLAVRRIKSERTTAPRATSGRNSAKAFQHPPRPSKTPKVMLRPMPSRVFLGSLSPI